MDSTWRRNRKFSDEDDRDTSSSESASTPHTWETYHRRGPGTHVIAIGSDPNSERAFEWACRTLPRGDRLVLVHGLHRHDVHDFSPEDQEMSFALMADKRTHNRRVHELH